MSLKDKINFFFKFQSSYKKLLLGASYKVVNGNCIAQNDMPSILMIPIDSESDVSQSDEIYFRIESLTAEPSEYKRNVLNYIAGFIQRKLFSTITCISCVEILQNMNKTTQPLFEQRNKGGLIAPIIAVEQIVIKTCFVLDCIMQEKNVVVLDQVKENLKNTVNYHLNMQNWTFLKELDDHSDVLSFGSHRQKIIDCIIDFFVTLRLHHFAKKRNEVIQKNSTRRKLTKLLHFRNH